MNPQWSKVAAEFVRALQQSGQIQLMLLKRHPQNFWTAPFQIHGAKPYQAAIQLLIKLDDRVNKLLDFSFIQGLIDALMMSIAGVRNPAFEAHQELVPFNYNWGKYQYPTFELDEGVAASLLLTDIDKLEESAVPWPFPAFLVTVPTSLGLAHFHEEKQQLVPITSFRVLRWKYIVSVPAKLKGYRCDDLYLARGPAEFTKALRSILDLLFEDIGTSKDRVCVRMYDAIGTSTYANYNWDGEGALVREWTTPKIRTSLGNIADERALSLVQKLAVNLAFYLSTRNENDQPVWNETLRTEGQIGRKWVIGRSVKIDDSVKALARELTAGRVERAAALQHSVRGHFKRAGKDKHRVWVQPYLRGMASDSETAPRTYEVK